MSLREAVKLLARGPGRSRHLTRDEAGIAVEEILSGNAAPEAVGAFLMVMRYRSEEPQELAGFVDALRAYGPTIRSAAAVDWPTYSTGRSRGAPWFLLSAKLLAGAGHKVLLHGWHGSREPEFLEAVQAMGIRILETPTDSSSRLSRDRIAYAPLGRIHPAALDLLKLRDVLGLRSPVNSALRLLNPAEAPVSLQGVFHPAFQTLQSEAAALIGGARHAIIKGGGGEFERHPGKDLRFCSVSDATISAERAPALLPDSAVRLAEGTRLSTTADMVDLWWGKVEDGFAASIVIGTTALALLIIGDASDIETADRQAKALWSDRLSRAPTGHRLGTRVGAPA